MNWNNPYNNRQPYIPESTLNLGNSPASANSGGYHGPATSSKKLPGIGVFGGFLGDSRPLSEQSPNNPLPLQALSQRSNPSEFPTPSQSPTMPDWAMPFIAPNGDNIIGPFAKPPPQEFVPEGSRVAFLPGARDLWREQQLASGQSPLLPYTAIENDASFYKYGWGLDLQDYKYGADASPDQTKGMAYDYERLIKDMGVPSGKFYTGDWTGTDWTTF